MTITLQFLQLLVVGHWCFALLLVFELNLFKTLLQGHIFVFVTDVLRVGAKSFKGLLTFSKNVIEYTLHDFSVSFLANSQCNANLVLRLFLHQLSLFNCWGYNRL